eukprot:SAG22_NODE_12569_length_437_cov_1.689349_1_plen_113_part_10
MIEAMAAMVAAPRRSAPAAAMAPWRRAIVAAALGLAMAAGVAPQLSPSYPIHKVHMVFMNLYDAGFKAEIQTVNNWAFHQWFPRAGAIADELRASGNSTRDRSVWTTDAWIVA